jgi:hypothetical protein
MGGNPSKQDQSGYPDTFQVINIDEFGKKIFKAKIAIISDTIRLYKVKKMNNIFSNFEFFSNVF